MGNILIITRVNSNMNNATHGGRDNEATAISSVVSKACSVAKQLRTIPIGSMHCWVTDVADVR